MLSDTNAQLTESVRCYRENPARTEIELRLGTYLPSGFQAGVTKDIFEQLERDLMECATLQTSKKWTEIVDYHYIGEHGEPVRTRVEYDTEGMGLRRTHVSKQTQDVFVYGKGDDTIEACKITRSLELPVTDVRSTCIPTHVRVKQRKTFRDVRDGNVVWVYELSRTWSANSRSAVEHLQNVAEPTYEIEVELVDERGTYRDASSDAHIAQSLLMKACKLMGDDEVTPSSVLSAQTNVYQSRKNKRRRQAA